MPSLVASPPSGPVGLSSFPVDLAPLPAPLPPPLLQRAGCGATAEAALGVGVCPAAPAVENETVHGGTIRLRAALVKRQAAAGSPQAPFPCASSRVPRPVRRR